MPQGRSYYLWEAVQTALEDAQGVYDRRLTGRSRSDDVWSSEIRETKVTLQLVPAMTQLLTIQFTHRVMSRSFIYYYSLKRQSNHSYRVYSVNSGRYVKG